MFLHTLPQQIWLVAMGLTCGYAIWRGGRPERIAGIVCMAAWFLSRLVYDYRDWVDPQWAVLAVDGALLLVFLWLALSTNRIWVLFASAFQLLGVIIHVAIMIDHQVKGLAYVRGLVIWSYLVIFSVALGAWEVSRRRRSQALTAEAPARR